MVINAVTNFNKKQEKMLSFTYNKHFVDSMFEMIP